MKKILNFFNSMQALAGLFFLALGAWGVWWVFRLFQEEEQLGLTIMYSVILVFAILGCLFKAWEHFKKAYDFTTHYSKEQRDLGGDLLIGRKEGDKYL